MPEYPGEKLAPTFFAPLNAQEEQDFQSWYAQISNQLRLDPNPDNPQHAYNYRAFWRAAKERPQDFRTTPDPTDDNRIHFPSLFKAADHPNRYVRQGSRILDSITGALK